MVDALVRRVKDNSSGATLTLSVVVLIAYLTMFVAANPPFSAGEAAVLLLLGAVYLCMFFGAFDFVAGRPLLLALYFAVLIALSIAIAFAARFSGGFWLMLLPIVAVGAQVLAPPWLIALCAVEMAAFFGAIWQANNSLDAAWTLALPLLPALIFVAIWSRLTMSEQQARREVEKLNGELAAANQKLREYAAQAEELATSRERNRLAREIHDSVGHFLTAINVQIEAARVLVATDPQRAESALDKAQSLTRESLADVRRSVAALRGGPTADRPLAEALEGLIAEVRSTGLVGELLVVGEPRSLSPQATNTLYRAAQEALTNVRKHALASRVDLTIDYSAADEVRIAVRDNGVGKADSTEGGFGLLGVRERAQIAGGWSRTESAPGQGFLLEVAVPA